MMFFRVFSYFRLLRVLFVVLLIAVVALSPDVGSDGASAQVAAPKGADGDSPVYRAALELTDYSLLFTPVKINRQEARALIDSGSFRAVQPSSTLAQSLELALTRTGKASRRYEGKEVYPASGRIESQTIGDYERRDVEVDVIEGDVENIDTQVGTKFDVFLGWGFISQFHTLLDYKRLSARFGKRPLVMAETTIKALKTKGELCIDVIL
jgi:Aspartyl protease